MPKSNISNIIKEVEKLCNEYKESEYIPTISLLNLFNTIKKISTKMHKNYCNMSLTLNKPMLSNIDYLVAKRHSNSRSEIVRNALREYLPKQNENQFLFNLVFKIDKQLKLAKMNEKQIKITLKNNSIVINGIEKHLIKMEEYNNDKKNDKKN